MNPIQLQGPGIAGAIAAINGYFDYKIAKASLPSNLFEVVIQADLRVSENIPTGGFDIQVVCKFDPLIKRPIGRMLVPDEGIVVEQAGDFKTGEYIALTENEKIEAYDRAWALKHGYEIEVPESLYPPAEE